MILHLVLLVISTVPLAIAASLPEKTVRHSGTVSGNNASYTIDGDPSTCCLAAENNLDLRSTTFAWFQVDLGATFSVTSVTLINSRDSSQYLQNFVVLVSNTNSTGEQSSSVCYTYNNGSSFANNADISLTLVCFPNPLNGRYVSIKRRGGDRHDALSLCEIKFDAILSDANLNLQNLPTNQTGAYGGMVSNRAIDGDTETCAEPEAPVGSNGWWSIDLVNNYIITSVTVFNTKSGSTNYLSYFNVNVGLNADANSQILCYNYNNAVPAGGNATLICSTPLIGRYVSVFRYGGPEPLGTYGNAKVLILCEIAVKGQLHTESSTAATSSSSSRASSQSTPWASRPSTLTSTTALTKSSAINSLASTSASNISTASTSRTSELTAAVIALAILLALALTAIILLGVYTFKLRRLLTKPPRSGLSEVDATYEKPQRSGLSEATHDAYEELRV